MQRESLESERVQTISTASFSGIIRRVAFTPSCLTALAIVASEPNQATLRAVTFSNS